MLSSVALRIGSLLLALYMVIVWACVYRFLGNFHPGLFGVIFSFFGITIFSVFYLVSRALSRQKQTGEEEKTAPAQRMAAGGSGLQTVKDLIALASRRLAESPKVSSQRVRTGIDRLPLYLVLGLEGSGKTSTIANSGIEPELLAGQVLRENRVVPTASANLWLANGVIFAELGGGFVSGDATQFARLLRLFRPGGFSRVRRWIGLRRAENLRAVVLCCDTSMLLGVPSQAQAGQAKLLQERLRSIGEVFGADFPVYVVFTKADQIRHFEEYFARITAAEHRQVLGTAVAGRPAEVYSDEAEGKRITAALNALYHCLAARRIALLGREPEEKTKLRAYEFPREVKRFRGNLSHFLVEVFRPNPLQPGPQLRGFYFTGIRQMAADATGTGSAMQLPLDNPTVLGQAPLEAPRVQGNGRLTARWAFAADLFASLIPGDQPPAMAYESRRHDFYRRLGLGAGIAALLVAGTFEVRSWLLTKDLLDTLRETAAHVPAVRGGDQALANLPVLDRLRELVVRFRGYREHGPPWTSLWLYAGDRLVDPARTFYFHRFHQYLLADTEQGFVRTLERAPDKASDSPGFNRAYNDLRGYLSITTKGCPADAGFLTGSWRSERAIEEKVPYQQFAYYVLERQPVALAANAALVDRGRRYLLAFDRLEAVYFKLLEEGSRGVKAARLADYTDKPELLTGETQVRAPFTREGARAILAGFDTAQLGTDPCVFGPGQEKASDDSALRQQLRARYLREYLEAWRTFLAGLRVVRYGGPADAARKLDRLSGSQSAVLAALFMAREHTDLPGGGDVAKAFLAAQKVFSDKAARDRMIGDQNRSWVKALRELQQAMERLSERESQESNTEADRAYRAGINAVKDLADTFPRSEAKVDQEVQRLLEEPVRNAKGLYNTDPAKPALDRLRAAAGKICNGLAPLRNKRPFHPAGSLEAAESDAARFFGFQTGTLWTVYKADLDGVLAKQGRTWGARPDSPVKVSSQFVRFFGRLASISDALFPQGSDTPEAKYVFKIVQPANVDAITVTTGGASFGPGEHELQWPASRFQLKVTPGSAMADYRGPWSVFLMAAEAKHPSPGVLELDYACPPGARRTSREYCDDVTGKDGAKVVVRIQVVQFPNGVSNAFDADFFDITRLGCPAVEEQQGRRE